MAINTSYAAVAAVVEGYQNSPAAPKALSKVTANLQNRWSFAVVAFNATLALIQDVAKLVLGNFSERGKAIVSHLAAITLGVVGTAADPSAASWLHAKYPRLFAELVAKPVAA